MAQILTQAEIGALLSAVNEQGDNNLSGQSSSSNISVSGSNIRPYDLLNQDRFVRGRMPIFDIIYDRFVRGFRISLSNSLRRISTVSAVSTDLLKFEEFVNTLPIPSCICIMRFTDLRGSGLIIFESKLVYAIIDLYFGGTDLPFSKIEGKEFTAIELSFIRKIMDMAIEDLEQAWSPIHKIDARYIRTEINPQFIGSIPPSDAVFVTTFDVEFEPTSGTMMVVVPYSTIEPIKHKLSSSFKTDNDISDNLWTATLEEHVQDTKIDLTVKLGESAISVGNLMNLSSGDIIPLSEDASGEVTVEACGVKKFRGMIGSYKGNKAIQIVKKTNG